MLRNLKWTPEKYLQDAEEISNWWKAQQQSSVNSKCESEGAVIDLLTMSVVYLSRVASVPRFTRTTRFSTIVCFIECCVLKVTCDLFAIAKLFGFASKSSRMNFLKPPLSKHIFSKPQLLQHLFLILHSQLCNLVRFQSKGVSTPFLSLAKFGAKLVRSRFCEGYTEHFKEHLNNLCFSKKYRSTATIAPFDFLYVTRI